MPHRKLIYYSQEAAREAAPHIRCFAEAEGFDGHAEAARLRS